MAQSGAATDLFSSPTTGLVHQLRQNPYVLGLASVSLPLRGGCALDAQLTFTFIKFASLGGFLFGYDQGVVSGVLTMESFAAKFPRIYLDSSFKGWFVSTLLLFAWFGSLVNGPVADRVGRKGSILVAVVIFTLGSALQAAAESIPMLFAGTFEQVWGYHWAVMLTLNRRTCDRRILCRHAHNDRADVHVRGVYAGHSWHPSCSAAA